MSTVEVDYVPGERVEVLMSDGTWVAGAVGRVLVHDDGLTLYHVTMTAGRYRLCTAVSGGEEGDDEWRYATEMRPALAPGDMVRWSSVPGQFDVVLVEGDQAVIRTTYVHYPQQLYVVTRSDLRQVTGEAVRPQLEERP